MTTKRIFVSFAHEGSIYRDFMKGQSLNKDITFTYIDMSRKI